MPLTAKGKKLKTKFQEQYGKKKGESVFYAMENSGKLKKVIKRRGGGGYQGGRKDTPAGAAPAGDVDRSAVGAGSQYSRNKAKAALSAQRKKTIEQLTPRSQTLGGKLLTAGMYLSGIPFAGTLTSKLIDKPYWQRDKKKKTVMPQPTDNNNNSRPAPITPIAPTKPIDPLLVKPKENFFNFVAYKSGGVSYGPPPKRGPNPQVPPVKMKKGKMNNMSCPHRPDGIRGMGAAIKGSKFIGVK